MYLKIIKIVVSYLFIALLLIVGMKFSLPICNNPLCFNYTEYKAKSSGFTGLKTTSGRAITSFAPGREEFCFLHKNKEDQFWRKNFLTVIFELPFRPFYIIPTIPEMFNIKVELLDITLRVGFALFLLLALFAKTLDVISDIKYILREE